MGENTDTIESDSISKTKLIELLLNDREHHFRHPRNINTRLLYAFAGILTTAFIGLILNSPGEKILNNFVQFSESNIWIFILIFLGLLFIIWGLLESMHLHSNQREQIEEAINYLLTTEKYSYKDFKARYAEKELSFLFGKCKTPTRIFDYNPDKRNWFFYHDRKSEIGIIIVVISLIYIVCKVAQMAIE